jgi:hypothetical protein
MGDASRFRWQREKNLRDMDTISADAVVKWDGAPLFMRSIEAFHV